MGYFSLAPGELKLPTVGTTIHRKKKRKRKQEKAQAIEESAWRRFCLTRRLVCRDGVTWNNIKGGNRRQVPISEKFCSMGLGHLLESRLGGNIVTPKMNVEEEGKGGKYYAKLQWRGRRRGQSQRRGEEH